MILKPQLIEGASPEMKTQIEALAKVAGAAEFDLYPCLVLSPTQFQAMPYQQLRTITGDWSKIAIPAGLKHEGEGVFSIVKAK